MAHNLATIKDRIAMVYSNDVPWHILGHPIPTEIAQDLKATLKLGSMLYQISLAPLYLRDGTLVDCRQAVLRDGEVILGTVGPDYEVCQNEDAFSIVEPLLGEGGMTIETAGALGNGEVAWLQLKNHNTIKISENDTVNTYLIVKTSHNGLCSVVATPTGQRAVCQNTLNMVDFKNPTIRIKHTQSLKEKIQEAKRILEQYRRQTERAQYLYSAMAEKKLSLNELADYWDAVFPLVAKAQEANETPERKESQEAVSMLLGGNADKGEEKDRDKVNRERREVCEWLLTNGKGQSGEVTAWSAYNSVTEYVDHIYTTRADGTYRTYGAQSALFGGGSIIRDKAWNAALQTIGSKRK